MVTKGGVDVRGRMKIECLSADVRHALIALKQALAEEPGVLHAQITLEDVRVFDNPGIKVDLIQHFPHPFLDNGFVRDKYEDVTIDVDWESLGLDHEA